MLAALISDSFRNARELWSISFQLRWIEIQVNSSILSLGGFVLEILQRRYWCRLVFHRWSSWPRLFCFPWPCTRRIFTTVCMSPKWFGWSRIPHRRHAILILVIKIAHSLLCSISHHIFQQVVDSGLLPQDVSSGRGSAYSQDPIPFWVTTDRYRISSSFPRSWSERSMKEWWLIHRQSCAGV